MMFPSVMGPRVMKKITLFAAFFAAFVVTVSAEAGEAAAPSYSEGLRSLRFRLPEGWAPAEGAPPGVAAFVLPSKSVRFQPNVNIVVDREPDGGPDLEKYSRHAEEQIEAFVPEIRILESVPARAGGLPARRVVFTGKLGGLPMKWLQMWLLHRGNAVVITYSAERGEFSRSLPSVEKALESLQVA